MSTSFRLSTVAVAAAALVGGVLGAPAAEATTPSSNAVPAGALVSAVPANVRSADSVLDEMTLRQRVGQLFMVGTPATSASGATLAAISRRHVGNVMLTGRSYGGTATPARVAAAMQNRATQDATDRVRMLVATDQEGGLVQVLHGRGLADLPSALRQGRWAPSTLRERAGTWAGQLRKAGVNMNLAPVEDTVPSASAARRNPPIGAFDREFGYRVKPVSNHGRAFAVGMSEHGVVPTIKHFPGLGRVHANTDTSRGVTDWVTTRHDAYLQPFAASVQAHVPVVMMSTAYYHRLDPKHPAAFSPFVINRMLRGDLGFTGVVISDDLANARQVSGWSYGARAVKFVNAGGNLVLTVDPASLPGMYQAVLDRAAHDAAFRAKVNASARRVLLLKQDRGLL
ncbi:MAG: glycoside hydrolase family 3 protein [Nocardioidaceae bacterium]|nr:glycoside hydrolase family 3 protein [Nocardioidaceae bacterium]NUS50339.1 glycoside hydrolase family 3 protein [Nocardioidaceae bacterium]